MDSILAFYFKIYLLINTWMRKLNLMLQNMGSAVQLKVQQKEERSKQSSNGERMQCS
jgi:hypothetical protein